MRRIVTRWDLSFSLLISKPESAIQSLQYDLLACLTSHIGIFFHCSDMVIETVTKKMTLAFWAVEHFLVIFHQICIKYTKSIWFSALKWGTVHFCTYLEIKDTGKNVKKCFFQFHHFCKKKFVKIMHHTLHHFCMNFLAKACPFLQKFKT